MEAKGENMVDKLDELFNRQHHLMALYKVRSSLDINTELGQTQVRLITIHLIEELCEILHALKNKPWVKDQHKVDMNEVNDEYADATHFFIELGILLGFDSDTMVENYIVKHQKNLDRVRTGY